jgi:hypothetical protein
MNVLKRLALLTSLPLVAAVLVAGCTATSGDAPTSTNASAVAPAGPIGSTPKPRATATSRATARPGVKTTPVGDPGDGGMLAGLGDEADWKSIVKACPHDGQQPIIQKVVTADVSGDGTYDAVIARTCESTTAYWPSTVEVFDGASPSDHPRRIGTLLTDVGRDDLPWLTKLQVTGRTVTVHAYGVDAHTTQACPSVAFTYRYAYDGDTFRRTAREVGDAGTCPSVG